MTDLRELFLLRPDVVYLNHGSWGSCPRPVFEAYQAWQLELEREPLDFWVRLEGRLREARAVLGRFVGASGDDLVFVPNTTTGVNIVARSLNLEAGDEVLTTDHEYAAMDSVWRFICAKRGACYVRRAVPLPIESSERVVEAVWAGVTERTRVLFLSHITSPTAITLPVVELVRRAREAGIITVVDGAHAPGHAPLNLTELGADYYAASCHKWMMAPKGTGFLFARPEMQALLEPLIVSGGYGLKEPRISRFVDEHQGQGTRDYSAYLTVPAAVRFMQEHGWSGVQRGCHELVRYARARLSALTGLEPTCPDSSEWFAQMATLPLPPCDVQAVARRLREEHSTVIPVFVWDRWHLARVSIQAYNSRADVDTLVDGLAALLPEAKL